MKMWILLHILAYFFNINVILGNLLETFEIFTNHLFCQRSGCAGCIVTPRRSLLQTWSLCLLDKNLPHFVYPQLKSCCSKHLDSWTLCISRIFFYRLLWQETVALWNKSNFHSVKRTTLNPHSFISIEFTQHKSTMILLQVKNFVQPFFCL